MQNILNVFVSPVAFKIGSLEIAWYGILMTIGFIFAILAASLKLKLWYKVSYDPFFYFCIIGIPVSILGARTWSFIIGDSEVAAGSNFFVDFWKFKNGGMAIQGGVVACVIAACIWFPLILRKPQYQVKTMKTQPQDQFGKIDLNSKNISVNRDGTVTYIRQVSMWVYADAIIPCILIGQIIGRWGNFFNHEVYGGVVENPETTMAWLKTLMPGVYENMFISYPGATTPGTEFRQPLFLYESFFNFWIFLFLFVACEFIKFRKCGDIGILYFFFYGVLRLCMEPFRDAEFEFVTSIVTSVLFIVVAIGLLLINHLVLYRYRDFKILYGLWIVIKFYCYLQFVKRIRSNPIAMKNYGYTKPISFNRKEEEMLYYREG